MKTRIFVLCLLCALLLSLSACTVGVSGGLPSEGAPLATAASAESADPDASPLEWYISSDGSQIYNEAHTYYYRFTPTLPFALDPASVYEYYYGIYIDGFTLPFENETYICTPYPGADLIWIEGNNGETRLYLSQNAVTYYETFFADQSADGFMLLNAYGAYAEVSGAIAEDANQAYRTADTLYEIDVTKLSSKESFELVQFDRSDSFYITRGAFYEIDGSYYYVDYRQLDNSYFDADGNFSYRQGKVRLVKIEGAALDALTPALDDFDYRSTDFEYEIGESEPMPIGLFWFCYVFLGFLVPIPFIVLGFILPHIAKLGRPKYWYVTAYLGIAWFVLAFVLMFLLI